MPLAFHPQARVPFLTLTNSTPPNPHLLVDRMPQSSAQCSCPSTSSHAPRFSPAGGQDAAQLRMKLLHHGRRRQRLLVRIGALPPGCGEKFERSVGEV